MALDHPAAGPPPTAGTGGPAATPRIRRALALPLDETDTGGAAASAAIAAAQPVAATEPDVPAAVAGVRESGPVAGRLPRPDTRGRQQAAAVDPKAEAAAEAVLTGSLAAAAEAGAERPQRIAALATKAGRWPLMTAAAVAGAVLVTVPFVHNNDRDTTTFEGTGSPQPIAGLGGDTTHHGDGSVDGPDGYSSQMPAPSQQGTDGSRSGSPAHAGTGGSPSPSTSGHALPHQNDTAVVPGTGTGSGIAAGAPTPGATTGDAPGDTTVTPPPGNPGGIIALPVLVGPDGAPLIPGPDGTPPLSPKPHPATPDKSTSAPHGTPHDDSADTKDGKDSAKFPVLTFGTTSPSPQKTTPQAPPAAPAQPSTSSSSSSKPTTSTPAAHTTTKDTATTPEVTPAKPAETRTPAVTKPAAPAKSVTPAAPAKPATPVTPAKSTVPAKPTTPAKPAAPAKPAKPANPAPEKPKSDPAPAPKPAVVYATAVASGSSMGSGQSVTNRDGTKVAMDEQGNLVVVDPSGVVRWSSHTPGSGHTVAVQGDGNLVVYDASGHALWASNTAGHPGAVLVIHPNGDVTVSSPDGNSTYWSAGTGH